MSFWENYKKELGIGEIKKKKVIVLVVVLILIGTGIWWYQHQKAVNYCKKSICSYNPVSKVWQITGGRLIEAKFNAPKFFPTQEQCIDYCLTVK